MMLFSDTGTRRSTKPRLFLTKNNPFGLLPNFSWSKIHAWLSMAQSLRLISDGNTLPAAQIASESWLSLIPSNHARHSLGEKIYYKLWNVSLMLLMHMTSRGKKVKTRNINLRNKLEMHSCNPQCFWHVVSWNPSRMELKSNFGFRKGAICYATLSTNETSTETIGFKNACHLQKSSSG